MVDMVTLFYNESCATCLHARDRLADLLAAADIPFVAKDVINNVDNRDHLILSSGQVGAPVVLIDKREIIGLDRLRLKRYLGIDVGQDHPSHW